MEKNKSYYEPAIRDWTAINAPLGKRLGYPDCCIKEFCEQPPAILERMSPTPLDRMRYNASLINGKFTGFIPCGFHAKLILDGKITLPELIKNRDTSLPKFPHV